MRSRRSQRRTVGRKLRQRGEYPKCTQNRPEYSPKYANTLPLLVMSRSFSDCLWLQPQADRLGRGVFSGDQDAGDATGQGHAPADPGPEGQEGRGKLTSKLPLLVLSRLREFMKD